jgi:WD40 repeat protein
MLTAMSRNDLRLAIAEPAARNGVVFQSGLIEQIIDDFQGQDGCLPLPQYTLNLLWEKDDITDRILNTQTYYDLGRVTGALQQQANKVYDELLPAEQQAARQIFIDLVDVVGGKPVNRRADKANFNGGVLECTLDKLISNRLLVVSKQEGQKPTVAVAHEALLTSWKKLQGWITEAKETIVLKTRLIDDARHWSNLRTKEPQKADGELWSGSKLKRVRELRGQPIFSNLSREVGLFIGASVAGRGRLRQKEEEQRQRELEQEKKVRKASQMRNRVAAISLLGLAGLTSFVFSQWNEAQKSTINALAQTSEASLLSNRQLEASVSAVEAGRQLNNTIFQDAAASQTANVALQRAVYNVQERNRLEGHSNLVTSVTFSLDGKTIASGSWDKTVKLWDVATGKPITTLNRHSDLVTSVTFSPDGKTIASGSFDKTVKLWDVATGKPITTFNGHSDLVTSVTFSPNGKTIASGSRDKTVKLWDVAPGKPITTFNGHSDLVDSVVFSPDGKTIASGSRDKTVKLWDVATGKPITTFNGHSFGGSIFSPNDKTIASVSWGKGKPIITFNDGKTIASGSGDKTVKWDVTTGKPITTFNGHSNSVNSVIFSPDGKTIASGSRDNTVKLWDVATGKPITTFNGHSNSVNSVIFSPDGKTIASGSGDKTVKLWNLYPNNLNDLMTRSCDLVRGYLQTNPNVSDSYRHLCDGI